MTTPGRRQQITVRALDAMSPGDEIWDTDVKGFYVRCQTAALVFVLKARIAGRQRHLTIGELGNPWTPFTAREEARRLRGLIANGQDPATQRERARKTLTVSEVALRFLNEHCGVPSLDSKFTAEPGASVKPSTARGYRDTIRDHIGPAIGKFRVDAITAADIAKLHHDLRAMPRAANYALSVVSVMYGWASARYLWPKTGNPTDEIKRFPESRRTKALDAAETKRLVAAISDAETENAISLYSAAALRFLLLCGLRPKEALGIRWTDIDETTGRVRLPDTKTGPRDAILSTHALALLAGVPRMRGNPYVFCGHKTARPLASLQNAFEVVWEKAKLPDEVVLYTLRHNFGSTLADNRVEAYELMKMMGHKNLSTSLRYIHLRDAGVQATSTQATASLATAMNLVKPARSKRRAGGEAGFGGR